LRFSWVKNLAVVRGLRHHALGLPLTTFHRKNIPIFRVELLDSGGVTTQKLVMKVTETSKLV